MWRRVTRRLTKQVRTLFPHLRCFTFIMSTQRGLCFHFYMIWLIWNEDFSLRWATQWKPHRCWRAAGLVFPPKHLGSWLLVFLYIFFFFFNFWLHFTKERALTFIQGPWGDQRDNTPLNARGSYQITPPYSPSVNESFARHALHSVSKRVIESTYFITTCNQSQGSILVRLK